MLRSWRPEHPWYLEGRTADGRRWTIPISRSPFVIGRRDDCDLALLDPTVSRRHAEISYCGDTVSLRDLGSTNGTFVNELRIREATTLRSGDTVAFGSVSFRVLASEDQKRASTRSTMFASIPSRREGFAEHYQLSRREEEVLELLLQGKSTKAIAEQLCVSFGTAKNHTSNIFEKCGVHSRYELIALYNNFSVRKAD